MTFFLFSYIFKPSTVRVLFFSISTKCRWVKAPCSPPAEFHHHYIPFVISSMNRSSVVDGLIIDFTLKSLTRVFMSDSEELIIYMSPIIKVPEKELILLTDYVIDYDTSHRKEVSPNHVESFPTWSLEILCCYYFILMWLFIRYCLSVQKILHAVYLPLWNKMVMNRISQVNFWKSLQILSFLFIGAWLFLLLIPLRSLWVIIFKSSRFCIYVFLLETCFVTF